MCDNLKDCMVLVNYWEPIAYRVLNNLGLGAFLVEQSFFPENERNDQERPHRSEKKTNA